MDIACEENIDEAKRTCDVVVNFCYNNLINEHFKKGCIDEAWCLFHEISARGLERNVVSYNKMLRGLFRGGRCENGLRDSDIINTYNILLEGLCSAHPSALFSAYDGI